MLLPEDIALMEGFSQGTAYMQAFIEGGALIPYPEVLANWLSLWAEHQAPEIARKRWS